MWIFALLAVAALAGVAAVAAGHGDPMRVEHPDRPDTGLPPSGPVTSDDLRRVRFPVVLRGYRMADVDALVARLIAERDVDLYRPGATASETMRPATTDDDVASRQAD